MTRVATVSGFRITAGADSGLRSWEELVTERTLTTGEMWKFQELAAVGGDTYTVANIPGMTNLRMIYIENHDATDELQVVINTSGPTAIITWDIKAGGSMMLMNGAPNSGEVITIVITASANTPQYTLILGDDA